MKKLLLATTALAAIFDPAFADPSIKIGRPPIEKVTPIGYACESTYSHNRATLYFNTQENMVYWRVGSQNVKKDRIHSHWAFQAPIINEFGYGWYLKFAVWDPRPEQAGGLFYWNYDQRIHPMLNVSDFRYGECVRDDEAGVALLTEPADQVVPPPEQMADERFVPISNEYRLVIKQSLARLPRMGAVYISIEIEGDGSISNVKPVAELASNHVAINMIKAIKKFPAPADGKPHRVTIAMNM